MTPISEATVWSSGEGWWAFEYHVSLGASTKRLVRGERRSLHAVLKALADFYDLPALS